MCGITGGVVRHGGPDFESSLVRNAINSLHHRGPDAEGVLNFERGFLGHTRLSILDLDERANQPMTMDQAVIVFNGEIYNYHEVRSRLESCARSFRTKSDTEVLLAAYLHYGVGCLQHLEGMFAFAIWDRTRRKLFLARDRFGEKPLVYYFDDQLFCFASEMTACETLAASRGLSVDHAALGFYFLYSYIPAPLTAYKRMCQLLPGTYLELDLVGWTKREVRYYDLASKIGSQNGKSYSTCRDELRLRLQESVKGRFLTSDVPVATFLSGGIDSSIVTCTASKLAPEVTAYSVSFPEDPEFNEIEYATTVAEGCRNVRHRVVPVTQRDLLTFTDRILRQLGEPFADASLIPTSYMCAQVEEKVALAGDGADELFGGYAWHPSISLSRRIPRVLGLALRALPLKRAPTRIRNRKLRALALFLAHAGDSALDEYFRWHEYVARETLEAMGWPVALEKDFSRHYPLPAPDCGLRELQVFDMAFNLSNDMLKKVDLASMYHSLEVRLPFLDSRLVEVSLALPDRFKIGFGIRKRILRDAFKEVLPHKILSRGKQGFLFPVRNWMKAGPLRKHLEELARHQTLFDWRIISQTLGEHARDEVDHSTFLWALYVLLIWKERG